MDSQVQGLLADWDQGQDAEGLSAGCPAKQLDGAFPVLMAGRITRQGQEEGLVARIRLCTIDNAHVLYEPFFDMRQKVWTMSRNQGDIPIFLCALQLRPKLPLDVPEFDTVVGCLASEI